MISPAEITDRLIRLLLEKALFAMMTVNRHRVFQALIYEASTMESSIGGVELFISISTVSPRGYYNPLIIVQFLDVNRQNCPMFWFTEALSFGCESCDCHHAQTDSWKNRMYT
jgi:hypothetical protein